jgi:hypothetical protein
VDVGPGQVGGDNLRAFGLEQACDGRTDARPRARDERTLAGEARHPAFSRRAAIIRTRLSRGRNENGAVRRGRHESPVAREHANVIARSRGLPFDEARRQL